MKPAICTYATIYRIPTFIDVYISTVLIYIYTYKEISCQMALISLQLVVGNVPEKGNANQDGIRIIEIMDSESKIDVAK